MLKICLVACICSLVQSCEYVQFGESHTMCQYEENACNPIARGVDQNGIDKILKAHNELRQKVANGEQKGQPSASNMNELSWSTELATIAQRWADQCKYTHDRNKRTEKYERVGQNLWSYRSSKLDETPQYERAVQTWYDEVTKGNFNPEHVFSYSFDADTGHYSQVVWATTEAVGCGFSLYKTKDRYYQMVVCNYGPAGNILRREIYKKGPACRDCTIECSNTYPGLCATE